MVGERLEEDVELRESDGGNRYDLWVKGTRLAILERRPDGYIYIHWTTHGPMQYHEARVMVYGLMEMISIADIWKQQEPKRGRKKTKSKAEE